MRTHTILLLALLAAGCGGEGSDPADPGPSSAGSSPSGESATRPDPAESDRRVEEVLAGSRAEARAFLKEGAVWCEGLSKADLEKWIEDLYRAGASEVVFTGLVQHGARSISAWLVVVLPTGDAPARARVFEAFNAVATDRFQDGPDVDRGQRYLDATMD